MSDTLLRAAAGWHAQVPRVDTLKGVFLDSREDAVGDQSMGVASAVGTSILHRHAHPVMSCDASPEDQTEYWDFRVRA